MTKNAPATEASVNETPTKKRKARKQRAWELDFLRGFSIIMVVWDHFMYDCAYMFSYAWDGYDGLEKLSRFAVSYLNSDLREIFWPVFVFIFFFVSGICTSFSKNNLFRGLKLAAVALLLSAVTYVGENYLELGDCFIMFGVLHCLALCILIFAVIQILTGLFNKKQNKWINFAVFLAVCAVSVVLDLVYNVRLKDMYGSYACVDTTSKIAGMFVYVRNWWTADYFPLLPFFCFFMLGAALSAIIYPNKKSLLPKLDGKWHYICTIPGRLSLVVYLGSQVLGIGILALVTYFVTGSFGL